MDAMRAPMRRFSKRIGRGKNTPAAIIARARAISDPISELRLPSILPNCKIDGVKLRAADGSSLSDDDFEWMFHAVKEMKGMYEKSFMDWNEDAKRNEIQEGLQRFLIASHESLGERLAFLSYRWDVEEGEAIMYVYEVYVEDVARKKSVAFALMRYAEELCRKVHVHRIILTVFSENRPAMALYRNKLSYIVDPDSPSRHGYTGVGYEILSKQVSS